MEVNRSGMTCCPFHNDRNPSMKVDRRFYCFGCGADGDVTANAKSIKEIKSFLSRSKEIYKVPYEPHPADRLRQCVFGGTGPS